MVLFWNFLQFVSFVALIIGLFYLLSKKRRADPDKKKRGTYFTIGGLLAMIVFGMIGSNYSKSQAQTAKVNGVKVSYNQLKQKVSDLKSEKSDLASQISEKQSKLDDLKAQNKDVLSAVKNKNELNQQIKDEQDKLADIKSDISNANDELKSVNSKISSAKNELARVKGEVTAAKGAPKTLNAGHYTVGKDIPASRYKAVPVGSGSNFIVYDSGDPVVNTILGSNGQSSYVFEATEGEEIQTEATVKLIPIK